MSGVPLVADDHPGLRALAARGIPPSNLYRALANQPAMLEAWTGFAWKLREDATTPRALRELLILRAAQLASAHYVWQDHVPMATAAGVAPDRIDALASWEGSDAFDAAERAALAFTDELIARPAVQDATLAALEHHFDVPERVELALTVGFYAMVPRVLEALRVPLARLSEPLAVPFR